ncbi:MAG: hypothetical protein JKY08_11860 [Flavobacteriaceae bacterium]|nr:hypothetical protein [Flavobacteriaceae bacterium]
MAINTTKINLSNELKIEIALEKIWDERYKEEEPIAPIFSNELYKNSITYLCLNPSLPPALRSSAKRGNHPDFPYPMVDWKLEKAAYPFFNKFYDLGKKFHPWTVMDLLYERDSSQKNLELKYNRKTISTTDKSFLLQQIRLTFKILKALNPPLVVLSNSFANKLIHEHLNALDIRQEIPSSENNYIYRLNGIPFITNESSYMGSRFLQKNKLRIKKLTVEIDRILTLVKQ